MPGYEAIGKEESNEVAEVFKNGGVLFRHGFDSIRCDTYKVRSFENQFKEYFGSPYSLAVSSGTAALRVALAALNIGEGDEVITQSFTFVATVEAIIESRAKPICVNIDKTLNLDPLDLENHITPKTKAVIAVHMLGVPSRLDEIKKICNKYNLFLIEDTAWGCGGSLNNKPLGTLGDIGTFSFDFAKTITTGEGGMLLIKDKTIYEKAAAWHDHGHENNPSVPRWEDTRSSSGFNFRMMELQGAVGIAQLRKLPKIVELQRKNLKTIWEMIEDLPYVELREYPQGSYETADALIFLLPNSNLAKICREELLKVSISTKILPEAYTWHFAGEWNHMKELNESKKVDYSSSEMILRRAVSIPIGLSLASQTPKLIRDAIIKAYNSSQNT